MEDRDQMGWDVMILGYDTRNEFTMHMSLYLVLAYAVVYCSSEWRHISDTFAGLESSVTAARCRIVSSAERTPCYLTTYTPNADKKRLVNDSDDIYKPRLRLR